MFWGTPAKNVILCEFWMRSDEICRIFSYDPIRKLMILAVGDISSVLTTYPSLSIIFSTSISMFIFKPFVFGVYDFSSFYLYLHATIVFIITKNPMLR